jgi:hypothetical protein
VYLYIQELYAQIESAPRGGRSMHYFTLVRRSFMNYVITLLILTYIRSVMSAALIYGVPVTLRGAAGNSRLLACLACSSTLMMEAAQASETWLKYSHRRENHKSSTDESTFEPH